MAKKKAKPAKLGRARIPIDIKLLGQLAENGCSVEEIAAMLRRSGLQVDKRTLHRRLTEPAFREMWEDGKLAGNGLLRSNMVRQSRMMNGAGVHMSIHLSKHMLGMTDKVEHSGTIDSRVEVDTIDDRLNRKLDALAERLAGRANRAAVARTTPQVGGEPDDGGEGEA